MSIGNRTIYMMGTTINLTVEHHKPEEILDECVNLLHEFEHRFSANDSASELNAINHSAGVQPIAVHSHLFELIKIGKKHSVASNSNLNITIGPLIQAWRIGFSDARVPAAAEIQSLLKITDPHKIQLNDAAQTVYLEEKDMQIDLGALAKGYIADLLIDYLKATGTQSALINLGGNLVTLGHAPSRPDGFWRIGVQNPQYARGYSQIVLKVKNQSVVTSGIYERQLEQDGEQFHHIFDPKTGYPIESDIASLTIISDLSIDGEIWTTRLFGKSNEEILNTINHLEGIEGIIISTEGDIIYSDGASKMLV